eukprot:3920177-Amphidinium_carterae.2
MSRQSYSLHKKHQELTTPSSSHTHQGQGAVERLHKTLFAQVHAIKFDLVERYNLQTPDNVPEVLLPWMLQHACFTINRYLVHTDGMTNYQRCWGVQCNSTICNFGEVVWADIKPITVNKLVIRNNEQKTEGIWLGKTFGWERQPTVVSTSLLQRTIPERSSALAV